MIMRHGRQCLLLRRSRVVAIIVRDGTREEFAKWLWDIVYVLYCYCFCIVLLLKIRRACWRATAMETADGDAIDSWHF
jgi:hypothetical protein